MIAYWQGNGFEEVILVNAKDFDDKNQPGDYVDSTAFSFEHRLEFTKAVLVAVDRAAKLALGGKLTVLIIKQLKGAGVHAKGAKSHNLYAMPSSNQPKAIPASKPAPIERLTLQHTTQINSQLGAIPNNSTPGKRRGKRNKQIAKEPTITVQFNK